MRSTRKSPIVLGIQYGGHDTAAALMIAGKLVSACEQERYSLEKHTRVFPNDAIADCLAKGGVTIEDVDEIAFCSDPMYYIRETYLRSGLEDDERIGFLINDIDRIKRFYHMGEQIREETNFDGHIEYHWHHLCHLASAYYPSGFDEALLVSYDGMGEIETGLIAGGRDGDIEIFDSSNRYPHSLGLLYSAITHYLGFRHHCDEGIIMGLAAYGDAEHVVLGKSRTYYDVFSEIVREISEYRFEIDTSWIAYHHVRDKWISDKFTNFFGPRRESIDPISDNHRDVAAALQRRVESIVINQLRRARQEFGFSRLALSGGVALNCTMNGMIEESGLFDEIFVQPASGDDGTTIGACYLSHKRLNGELKPVKLYDFYLGSSFTEDQIIEAFADRKVGYRKSNDIYWLTAKELSKGKIVGWFQGGSEFGPRALGNRSILTRPYPAEMKDYLNARVKFREPFRPFAPAILHEHTTSYFQIRQESPHMLIATKVIPDKKDTIAATVHVDDSCRIQTVRPENNARFYKLLQAFHAQTDCPVILNTSFNVKGQPIVNTPRQAIDCFNSTKIDFLVIGDYYTEKTTGEDDDV